MCRRLAWNGLTLSRSEATTAFPPVREPSIQALNNTADRSMNIRSSTIQKVGATDQAVLPREGAPATAPDLVASDLKGRAETVAAVAAEHAGAVDQVARFPSEAIAAARRERLLGIMVPHDLGGEGASIS